MLRKANRGYKIDRRIFTERRAGYEETEKGFGGGPIVVERKREGYSCIREKNERRGFNGTTIAAQVEEEGLAMQENKLQGGNYFIKKDPREGRPDKAHRKEQLSMGQKR